jgi:hypothetical protein
MKTILALLALTVSSVAFAGGNNNQNNSDIINNTINNTTNMASNAGNSVTVEGDSVDIPKIASTAVAPSVSQGTTCPVISPSSKAGSVFFFSGSGTTGVTVNGICVAWHEGDKELVHQIACDSDANYRRAITKLGRECN